MKKDLINHKWLCKRCGKWIGEDYDECSFCEIKELEEAKKVNLKNFISSNWDLLTKYRKKIFTLKFKGKRDCEIARIFGVSRQAINCTIKQSIEKINLKRL
jgi:predicted DNA-binding protein YlxM (UPF0122 family)